MEGSHHLERGLTKTFMSTLLPGEDVSLFVTQYQGIDSDAPNSHPFKSTPVCSVKYRFVGVRSTGYDCIKLS